MQTIIQTINIECLTYNNFNAYLKQISQLTAKNTHKYILQINLVAQINSLTIALLLAIKRANIVYTIQTTTDNIENNTELTALIELYGLQSLNLLGNI